MYNKFLTLENKLCIFFGFRVILLFFVGFGCVFGLRFVGKDGFDTVILIFVCYSALSVLVSD